MNAQEYITDLQSRPRAGIYRPRIAKLTQLAADKAVPLDKITVVINRSMFWSTRRNRTAAEATAIKIGQSNDKMKGYPKEVVWAYAPEVGR
jgi:hypothetical protein